MTQGPRVVKVILVSKVIQGLWDLMVILVLKAQKVRKERLVPEVRLVPKD